MLAPCRQRSRQNQWNRTAFWEAHQRGFGPSWAERENILILFLSPYLMMRKLERFYYNWLLIKNSPLKISLLPKLCCHHQSNLNQGKKKKNRKPKPGFQNMLFINQVTEMMKETHFALNLPWLCNGWQVTSCHHHGPGEMKKTKTHHICGWVSLRKHDESKQ